MENVKVTMKVTSKYRNNDVGNYAMRDMNAAISYDNGRTASYGTRKYINTATFISKAIDFTLTDAIQAKVSAIDLTIVLDGITVPQDIADHIASWYTLDEIINEITFE